MSHGHRRDRFLAGLFGCLLAAGAFAADDVQPDAGFLEFLGSWSGEEAADEWFDFLDSIAGASSEAPGSPAPEEDGTDHETP